MSAPPITVVLRCAEPCRRKAAYVFETLFMAARRELRYADRAPETGAWILYADRPEPGPAAARGLWLPWQAGAWSYLDAAGDPFEVIEHDGLPVPYPAAPPVEGGAALGFDVAANGFYFLASWSERHPRAARGRRLYADSVFARLGVPQDVVDRYLRAVLDRLATLEGRAAPAPSTAWPQAARYAVVLSHDVDFVPRNAFELLMQGVKSVLRHALRQRDGGDALRAAWGWLRGVAAGRDIYGCLPDIIAEERRLGVRASFQVAVARRHPADVNYRIEDDAVRDYLRCICEADLDLCLHGSYRSTEQGDWYEDEAALLTRRLGRPLGSRQHFLSFDYDRLFAAQERCGIEYDMSLGYPDQPGPRSGFSFPFFPYCIAEDRPYRVLQLGLGLMDVTLRSYLRCKGEAAWARIEQALDDLAGKGGCLSVVWHPIVFGGARDPGDAELYWRLVRHVAATGGLATDGRAVNHHWRAQAGAYPSFSSMAAAMPDRLEGAAAWPGS